MTVRNDNGQVKKITVQVTYIAAGPQYDYSETVLIDLDLSKGEL